MEKARPVRQPGAQFPALTFQQALPGGFQSDQRRPRMEVRVCGSRGWKRHHGWHVPQSGPCSRLASDAVEQGLVFPYDARPASGLRPEAIAT